MENKDLKQKNEQKEKNKDQKVHIKIVGQIELPTLDVSEYVGKKVKIVDYGVYYNEKFGSHYVKFKTEKLGEFVNRDNETKDITASRIFGLYQDKDGNFGWGEKTQLGLFLKKYKCETLEDVKKIEVITQSKTRENGDVLTFN
jgi:hypothetical protein